MPIDSWDDQRVDVLTKMWAEGHSATQIALALGCSRSAVIGKVSRLKLPPPAEKLPVIIDRTYTRMLPDERLKRLRAYERVYKKARRDAARLSLASKRDERKRLLDRGASPYSPAYRKQLPPLPDMTKGELRAMLAQAMQNTAAL